MKLAIIFTVLISSLTTAYSWNPLALLQDAFQSPIPQFILDTNHPWLQSNKAWLSRYPNVREAICTPNSSLWTHPATPARVLPEDLFANLTIDNDRRGVTRAGWENFAHRLHEIRECPAALDGARYLHIDVHVYDHEYISPASREPTQPPHGIPTLAADVLDMMTKLERLDWGISGEATRAFEPAFIEKGVILPSVRYLQPGAWSDYLVSRCPNLEILEAGSFFQHASWKGFIPGMSDPRLDLIQATTGMSLKEVRLDGLWSLKLLESILYATPNITSLTMNGPLIGFGIPRNFGQGPRRDDRVLRQYLSILRQFPSLMHLQLPASNDLELGFDGGAWCGNAYDGPEGRWYGRLVVVDAVETVELAANVTLAELPDLRALQFGLEAANLTLNEDGKPDMTWPWTGRLEQYTYEIWPE